MLQNKQNENKENININKKLNNNEKQEIKNKEDNSGKNENLNLEEKNKNEEIINNLLNNPDKNTELKFKISESNSIENVKQDIINFYLIEKQKYEEKKKEIDLNKNNNNYNTNIKRRRPNSSNKNPKNNRFEKYDKERISYEIYHQYQKLKFNFKSIPFIQRMELYSLKRCLKDYKLEELLHLQSPKISEKEKVQTFNRLIEDSNRRLFKSKKNENKKINKEKNIKTKEIRVINNNKNKNLEKKENNKEKKTLKTFNKKKWDEIYEKRFGSKLKEKNEKLEKLRKDRDEKIKKEEDRIIDDLNKKEEIFTQRYGMKRNNSAHHLTKTSIPNLNINKYYIGNSRIVTNLNQRLYYNEMTKRDIGYKTFLEKANRLMDTCEFKERNKNNIKKWNKSLDIKINSFRTGAKIIKKKNLIKSSSAYNFIDSEDKNSIQLNKEEEKNNINNNNNNNNCDKTIKDEIDLKINETSIANNSKSEINGSNSIINNAKNDSAEKIIDIFFDN